MSLALLNALACSRRLIVPMLLLLVLAPVGVAAGRSGVSLMMVEEPGCRFCRKWDAEIGRGYAKSDEGKFAPLVRVGRKAPELSGLNPIIYTPTFIVVRDGVELGRIAGYPGADYFWPELDDLLAKAGYARGLLRSATK